MKKTLLLIAIVLIAFANINAQDVFNLGVNDSIITNLRGYNGTNIVLVIPQGYTNPLGATAGVPNSIDLSKLTTLSSNAKITIKGDGSNPTVLFAKITLPATLSKLSFSGLTITGAVQTNGTVDPTLNYIINSASTAASVVDSVVFDNCNVSGFRSLVRFQSTTAVTAPTQKANNVIINNCIMHNFADYGVVYNSSTGGFFGPVKVTKSTFYGFGATVFMLQKNATSIDISDCTFDNVMNVTTAKAIVDFASVPHPTTLTNCIFGKAISGANSIITGGVVTGGVLTSAGTLAIANCYTASDWLAAAPIATSPFALPSADLTGAFTAYTGASTDLFTSVSVSTVAAGSGSSATPYTTTVGNYKIKDASFAGANSAGDPRWYLNATTAVKQTLSDKGVSFNGTEIVNTKGLPIEVYSVLGKKVASSMTSIPTTNFQKGVYIVRVSGLNDSLKICI
ncbi:MAG: DUF4957 domain-containing protein [Paludibacter sp.]|nr:DUF4957 domain-containing protein [Paludibacter sp.]